MRSAMLSQLPGRIRPRRRLLGCVGVALALSLGLDSSIGQEQEDKQQRQMPIQQFQQLQIQRKKQKAAKVEVDQSATALGRSEWEGLVPPSDQDTESWLKRAEDAISRGEWKLATDTLMRVIEDHAYKTVSVNDGEQFVSALQRTQQILRNWPEEGLATYRLLFDPEVRTRLDQARAAHDVDALRDIARTFPLTGPGPEAMDLLATWLIDAHEGREAARLLRRLLDLPQGEIAADATMLKLAVAEALAGRYLDARHTLGILQDQVESGRAQASAALSPRIVAVRKWIDDVESAAYADDADQHLEAWPRLLGPADRLGRMARVDVTAAGADLWSAPLPGSDRLNPGLVHRLIDTTGHPPVWQLAADGRRVFATCEAGLIARDMATFEFLWQAVPKRLQTDPRINQFRFETGMLNDNSDRLDELTTRALFHEYRGAVSTAHGLAFIIEQAGTPGEEFPTMQGVVPLNDAIESDYYAAANSIVAYEADTGRMAWIRGRGGPPDDELRFAHFFAPPIAAGDRLIAPYQYREDLYLAVMTPEGDITHRVHLGTGKPGMFPMNGVLWPTVAGDTVFVSTGAGALVALHGRDYSLRWIGLYDRPDNLVHPARARGWGMRRGVIALPQPDMWLSSPPLAVGDVVIHAPHDSAELLAFDIDTGALLWSRPRADHRYMVGSDGQRVIVAGRQIAAIRVQTGDQEWAYSADEPFGRPVISGSRLLVPTASGLVALHMDRGAKLDRPIELDRPLGNLYALDGALYSVSATQIDKFPDLERSRRIARRRLASHPDDAQAVLRLAWLDILQARWTDALERLDKAEAIYRRALAADASTTGAPGFLDRLSHQRVNVLLNLAGDVPAEQRAEILAQAVSAARRGDDEVRANLAHAEHRAELGDGRAAFRQTLDLLERVPDQILVIEPQLRGQARILIREQLHRLWKAGGAAARGDLGQDIDERIERLIASEDDATLTQLAWGLAFAPQAAALDLRLGRRAHAMRENESATYFYQRAARRAESPDTRAAALLNLAWLLAAPGEGMPAAPHAAVDALNRLANLDGTVASGDLAPDLAQAVGAQSVAGVVDRIQSFLPSALRDSADRLPYILYDRDALRMVDKEDVMQAGLFPMSFYDPNSAWGRFSELTPICILNQVKGLNLNPAHPERVYWTSELSQPPRFRPTPKNTNGMGWMFPAAVSGRIACLVADHEVTTIGLVSGRVQAPPLFPVDTPEPLAEPVVIAVDGIFVAAADANTLVAIDARPDARPLWRRHLGGHGIRHLAVVDGHLVAIGRNALELTVLNPHSGRIVRRFALVASSSEDGIPVGKLDVQDADAHVTIAGNVVARSGYKQVEGRDVHSGRIVWTVELDGLVKSISRLDDRHIAICYRGRRLVVIDVQKGETIREMNCNGLNMPPVDMVLDRPGGNLGDQRLLVLAVADEEPNDYMLVSFPLSDRAESWRRPLKRYVTCNARMMRESPEYVAVVQYEVAEAPERNVLGQPQRRLDNEELVVYDKATGDRLTSSVYRFSEGDFPLTSRGRSTHLVTDVMIFDQRIIAVSPEGYRVLGIDEEQPETTRNLRVSH